MRPKNFVKRNPGGGQAPPKIDQKSLTNINDIQAFNNGQVYTKGFSFTTTVGSGNEFPIQLGGKCRRLFGVNFFVPLANIQDNDIISLIVNEEVIIDKVNWRAYSANTNNNPFKVEQYFSLPRALSGSDTVMLTVNSVGAHQLFPIFYLANS